MNNSETRSSRSGSLSNTSSADKSRTRSSTDTTGSRPTGFDVLRVYESFVNALREPENAKSPIGTQDYIDGYRELLKFCDQLGYVFKFVKDDVVDKLGILQRFVDRDQTPTKHFDTLQNAINYELEKDLIKSNPTNFARTLLRLHRALLFIIQFLQGLAQRAHTESASTIASACYDATLYQHHGFLIRKSVKIGFRVLPSRQQLDDIIFHGRKEELKTQYQTFMQTIQQIYDIIQNFYTEKHLLTLP